MKRSKFEHAIIFPISAAALFAAALLAGCGSTASSSQAESGTESTAAETTAASQASGAFASTSESAETSETSTATFDSGLEINGHTLSLAESGDTDLDLLSVENGITIMDVDDSDKTYTINGEALDSSTTLDVSSITRDETFTVGITENGSTQEYTVNLMPSTFLDYTTTGESKTDGDYYLSTRDEDTNYIFKLNNSGDLIFYKKTENNSLYFQKNYNSAGEVRYTYSMDQQDGFAGLKALNPGCLVVMDENYNVIDEVYYKTEDGEDLLIDPHGYVYLDDGHYILATYKEETVDVPEDLSATDNQADMAVLYVEEIKDDEIQWQFRSADYDSFYEATTTVTWNKSTEQAYDYMHFNAFAIDQDDNLLVSCRNINSILKLSRTDGSLQWILGGSQDQFGLSDDQKFSKQHSIIVCDDGSYMLFNNADDEVSDGSADVSSIIHLKVDESTKKVTAYSKLNTTFYSAYMGSIRELDSENGYYLYAVGGSFEEVPEYSLIEYQDDWSDTENVNPEDGTIVDKAVFTFRFNDGKRLLYCANKYE